MRENEKPRRKGQRVCVCVQENANECNAICWLPIVSHCVHSALCVMDIIKWFRFLRNGSFMCHSLIATVNNFLSNVGKPTNTQTHAEQIRFSHSVRVSCVCVCVAQAKLLFQS